MSKYWHSPRFGIEISIGWFLTLGFGAGWDCSGDFFVMLALPFFFMEIGKGSII